MAALGALLPILVSYLLSFISFAIYWNNRHHLRHAVLMMVASPG